MSIGTQITVTGVPGSPQLTIVGFANSITQTAAGLGAAVRGRRAARAGGAGREPDAVPLRQRRHQRPDQRGRRPRSAARCRPARCSAPQSYLTVKLQDTSSIAPWVPFIVAFGMHRAGHVGADRGQRGQRRRGGRDPPDRRAEVHRLLARAGGGLVRDPGRGARAGRLRARRDRRQPAVRAAARPDRAGLRRGRAGRAGLGRRGRAAGHARPGRRRRGAARAARGPDERGAGHRDRPRAAPEARLRRAPGAGPGPLDPAAAVGDHRPGRAVRPARPGPRSPWRPSVRRRRGDVRRGPGRVAEPGLQRPVALGRRAGAGVHPRRRRARAGRRLRRGQRPGRAVRPPAQPGRAGAGRPGRAARPARHAALRGRIRRPDRGPGPVRPAST